MLRRSKDYLETCVCEIQGEGKTGGGREEKREGGDAKRFTFHVPGRLIKFQKLKHHLLRVVQSARRRPGKVGRASCHPFQRIKHIFHQTRLPTDQPSRAKFRPVWTVASHLERPEKSLSLSVFTNFLYLVVRISLVDHRRFNPRSDSPDRKTMRRWLLDITFRGEKGRVRLDAREAWQGPGIRDSYANRIIGFTMLNERMSIPVWGWVVGCHQLGSHVTSSNTWDFMAGNFAYLKLERQYIFLICWWLRFVIVWKIVFRCKPFTGFLSSLCNFLHPLNFGN